MSDDMPEQPAEKATVKFEPPPKWAESMFARVHEGIAAMEARVDVRLDDHGSKLDACISGLKTVNGELEDVKSDFHEFKGATNARLESNSMRAKQESVHDDTQDAKLKELENRLAAQAESSMRVLVAEMKAAATVAAKTPLGKQILKASGYALLAALGLATVYLGRLQAPPQPAPSVVYVTAPADAGAE